MSLFVAEGSVRHQVPPLGTRLPQRIKYVSVDLLPAPESLNFCAWVKLPSYVPRKRQELTGTVRRLISETGWSNRRLAMIVGTTHPTIGAIAKGREPERNPQLRDALIRTADVVARISALTHGDRRRLNATLQTPLGASGRTPLDLLASGRYAQAYLTAVDVIRGRRQPNVLLTTDHVRQPSQDVILISEDDDE